MLIKEDPTRSFRDMVATDAWHEMIVLVGQLEAREINALVATARDDDIFNIKRQSGIVEGIQRVITLIKSIEAGVRGEN